MDQPHESYEGTALWNAVARAIADLEARGELTLAAERSRVVDAVCDQLLAAGVATGAATRPEAGTRGGFASFLDRVARDDVDPEAWRDHVSVRYTDAAVEEARRQAVLLHLRLSQGGLAREQAAEYFRALARGLREPTT